MNKPRIPLPKQTQQAFKDKSKYDRKDLPVPEGTVPDWQVDCPNCGVFIQIQKTDPTICPRCGEPDIDTFNLGA